MLSLFGLSIGPEGPSLPTPEGVAFVFVLVLAVLSLSHPTPTNIINNITNIGFREHVSRAIQHLGT